MQTKELKVQNEQLVTVNTTLGSEVSKLQKELEEVRSHQSDGGRELQEELERLRQQLQEAIASRKKLEEEHVSEKMELSQVKRTARSLCRSEVREVQVCLLLVLRGWRSCRRRTLC